MAEGGEKTEEPTDKKIRDAREQGNVWKSQDLKGVLGFVVAMGMLKAIWPFWEERIRAMFLFGFHAIAHPEVLFQATQDALTMGLWNVLLLALPVVLSCALVGGLTDFLLVGALFSPKVLTPKIEKLNPINGFKNLFSKRQLMELPKSLVKMGVTGYVAYLVVRSALGLITLTVTQQANVTMALLGELIFRLVVRVSLAYLAFAIFDVWFQHYSYRKQLKMSVDEVKREYKQSEGDPHNKAKRKEMHHEIVEGAQMAAVAEATVVVTNPEHVAVALKYDKEKDSAPRVIAKGLDSRAQSIKALARRYDVAVLRNVPLAHALFRVEVGNEIPEELYDAVAEVLNFVYHLSHPDISS
ncbi:MAG: type III secretion system export apparatus subunit SctU [Proteobacteria bacterium]|nr:type III secretion system export apparatus subunit SctU [Cystobacterineae bacterium]MCL2258751.1 type III secretion system export apparatus subunit SctU [Cystobacterineae bacterium]MCL2314535.1 type III secretion system export apparatus subunit SctU [Pseudomonadota bacterium]